MRSNMGGSSFLEARNAERNGVEGQPKGTQHFLVEETPAQRCGSWRAWPNAARIASGQFSLPTRCWRAKTTAFPLSCSIQLDSCSPIHSRNGAAGKTQAADSFSTSRARLPRGVEGGCHPARASLQKSNLQTEITFDLSKTCCGWMKSCPAWKPWTTIVRWYLQGNRIISGFVA